MTIDPKDNILVKDYIHTIKQQEIVLWEGKMVPVEIKNTLLKDEILLIITLVFLLIGISIATFLIHVGLTLITLSILLGGYLFSLQKEQKTIRQNKLKYSHYIITSKQCICIHWYKQQIHINSIAAKSIQKISTYRTANGEISILFHTNYPIDFEMSYYTNNTKTDTIGFINIGRQASTITKVIRDQVLKEK